MTISTRMPVEDNDRMASTHPCADGPRRRMFSPADKLSHLAAYEQACETNEGGGVPTP